MRWMVFKVTNTSHIAAVADWLELFIVRGYSDEGLLRKFVDGIDEFTSGGAVNLRALV